MNVVAMGCIYDIWMCIDSKYKVKHKHNRIIGLNDDQIDLVSISGDVCIKRSIINVLENKRSCVNSDNIIWSRCNRNWSFSSIMVCFWNYRQIRLTGQTNRFLQ